MPGIGNFDDPERNVVPLTCEVKLVIPRDRSARKKAVDRKFPLLLYASAVEHTYRGYPLAAWVEGLRRLLSDGVVSIHPDDAERSGLCEGDEVIVTSSRFERVWPVKIAVEQPRGTMHVTLPPGDPIGSNPHPVRIRKKDV